MTAFSQSGTNNTTRDSSVILPKKVAIEAVKDIIRKDSLESEVKILKANEKLLVENITLQDSIIKSKNSQIGIYQHREANFDKIISFKDQQKANSDAAVKKLNSDLKKTKVKLAVRSTVSLAIIGVLTYLVIAK